MANQADLDFFRPLWRRIALVAVISAWFAYETFFVGESMWIVIVGGTLAYAVWTFFIKWNDKAG